ncbi:hypothetical protein BDQ17DRAFT_1405569 [Cyathus striatus]|nr:hypothetical protein BDQ17DRAFT_1405569 [Cyathus striatus]
MPLSLPSIAPPHPSDDYFTGDAPDDSSPGPPTLNDNSEASPDHDIPKEVPSVVLQALMNCDILTEIFSLFDVEPEKPSHTDHYTCETLRIASLTCKAWTAPALDVLWSVLPSWIPLLSLLPNFQRLANGAYVLRGNFTEDEIWKRFKSYACRVKSLYMGSNDGTSQLSPHIFVRLAKYQKEDSFLLPALRHLHFPNCTRPSPDWEGVFLALSPNLQSISMENIEPQSNDFVSSLISVCTCDSPNLQYFSLNGSISLESTQEITMFRQLRTLEIKTFLQLDPIFIRSLGQLPSLVNLTIRMPNDTSSFFAIWTPGFKSLKTLHVIGPAMSMQKLLKCVSPDRLESLTLAGVSLSSNNLEAGWKECFEFAADMILLQSLSILKADNSDATLRLTYNQLSPLFLSKRLLEELNIDVDSLDISDDDIYNMAYSLPEIRILKLPKPSNWQSESCLPTFKSLRTLSLLCPWLQLLAISVQSSIVPASIPTLHLHKLQDVTINTRNYDWSMNQMISLSHFIYAAFPNANLDDKKMLVTHNLWDNSSAQSSEIKGLISVYQSIHTSLMSPTSEALAAEVAELWARNIGSSGNFNQNSEQGESSSSSIVSLPSTSMRGKKGRGRKLGVRGGR